MLVVLAGVVHGAADVRKLHTYRTDAFGSGDAGPIAHVEEGRLRSHRPWPQGNALGLGRIAADADTWPWVEVIASHAGARAGSVQALLDAGVRGLVVAGTGNGTVHQALEPALQRAAQRGVPVWRCTRCPAGVLVGETAGASPAAALSPWQARIELMLDLLGGG